MPSILLEWKNRGSRWREADEGSSMQWWSQWYPTRTATIPSTTPINIGRRCAHYLPDGLTCTSGIGRGHLDQCNSNNNGVKEAGKLKLNMMATLAHRTGIAPHINITYGEATGWPPTDRPHPPPRIVELLRRGRGRGQTWCRPYMMLSSNNSANLIAMIVRRIPRLIFLDYPTTREDYESKRGECDNNINTNIYGLRHDGDNGKTMAMTWQSTYLAFTFKTTINQRNWNIAIIG